MSKIKGNLPESDLNSLISHLSGVLDKQFKDQQTKTVYSLGTDFSPSDVDTFVSTGCYELDLVLANRPDGGFPVGRISELTGLESSGKSLLGAHALVDTQKKGGVAVYIDTEAAISKEFLKAIGVNLTSLMYIPLETIEDVFTAVDTLVTSIRTSDKKRLVTILVDSVMGASTKRELAADYSKEGYSTDKAIIISQALRKLTNMLSREKICLIFTNQLRQKVGVMGFADPWQTSGGKAIAFHSSIRIRLKSTGQVKAKTSDGREEIIGINTKATVIKNRIAPPMRSADFEISFRSGIEDEKNWFEILLKYGAIKKSGSQYLYEVITEHGEVIEEKFYRKNWTDILQKYKLVDKVKTEIAEFLKFSYENPEEISVVAEPLPED